ncbi:MAG: type I pullulanase [Coprobacillus sp.]|nr:type I pullulanase [Coprobacillus sp.]
MKKTFKGVGLTALSALLCLAGTSCNGKNTESVYPTYDEPSIAFHYQRSDKKENDWELWLWGDVEGAAYGWNGSDSFGKVCCEPLSLFFDEFDPSSSELGFIVRTVGGWSAKDATESDRFVEFANLEADQDQIYHVYLVGGDANLYISPDLDLIAKIYTASFARSTRISVTTSINTVSWKLYIDGELDQQATLETPSTAFSINLSEDGDVTKDYVVEAELESGDVVSATVAKTYLFENTPFTTDYVDPNQDTEYGAIYSEESTTFRVWSPVSSAIELRIYESGTPKSVNASKGDDTYTAYTMTKDDKGNFEYEVSGDLDGKYYTYAVTNSSYTSYEVVDPYAKSAGINGLRGMVVNFESEKATPEGWDESSVNEYDRKELTVYETHLVDLTSSSTWGGDATKAKTYEGFRETGTTYTEGEVTVTTGFDHIKELGVNAVQLQPIFDQANEEDPELTEFNWGYNPLNYNVLEGSYSSDPYDGYARIKEFRELVMDYNNAGINIIMDVVYNHVNGALRSNFDVLVPGYYFRYNDDGSLSNGSGCGNETASDHGMFSKFMVDSTVFWADTYKLGGFRFDLMGLHDLDTMQAVTEACKEVNESIVIYGEPWTGGSTTLSSSKQATQANAASYVGYGAFNDQMRDALIKGGLSADTDRGWITNTSSVSSSDIRKIQEGIEGYTYTTKELVGADYTNNYVTCHDNYTLYDRIVATGAGYDETTIKEMATLANSIVFTSKGTSFMLAGEEFLRTKGGDSNSYESGYAVNALDYSLKIKNADTFDNYKSLIAFKKNCSYLHEDSDDYQNVITDSTTNAISYTFESGDYDLFVGHANGVSQYGNEKFDLSGYTLYLDTLGEYTTESLTSATELLNYQTLIAYKAKA